MTTAELTADASSAARVSGLRTFAAMMARELHVLRREALSFVGRTVMQPLLYIVIFAYILPEAGVSGGTTGFATALVPGMVSITLVQSGIMGVTFPLIFELSWAKEITDRLLAPLPLWGLVAQKITTGAVQAFLGGLVVYPIVLLVHAPDATSGVSLSQWPTLLVVMVLGALMAPAFGLFLGTMAEPQKVNQALALVLMPVSLLGCVFYPWSSLSTIPWLQWLSLLNPVVYVSEGLRAGLTPAAPHLSTWITVPVLLFATVALGSVSVRTFGKRALG